VTRLVLRRDKQRSDLVVTLTAFLVTPEIIARVNQLRDIVKRAISIQCL
jgi:hypothetical protein